jgi:hypothetical protein
MDYKNGKIYTLRSPHTDKYYIGSTTTILAKRLHGHKKSYMCYLKNGGNFTTSFDLLSLGDVKIELLEEFPCKNKMELEKREGELQREHKNMLVNKYIASRTRKEWIEDNKEKQQKYMKEHNKEYYIKNKEIISEQKKDYYKKNRESILEKKQLKKSELI